MASSLFDKLIPKNKHTNSLYVILIIGIVIIVFGGNLFNKQDSSEPPPAYSTETIMPDKELEANLKAILSQIQGAGTVDIMITYESTGEKVYAIDVSEQSTTSNEDSQSGANKQNSNVKSDKKTITPSNTPVVAKEVYPKVKGVIVVAQGAGDATVKQNIITAVKSVLDVPDHKISVFVKQ